MRRLWRYLYGENPLHLLVLLACFALAGAVVAQVAPDASAWWILVWFLGAVIGHDLVLFPLYALADGSLLAGRRAARHLRRGHPPRVAATNHLRMPALGSGVVALIWLPTITAHAADAFAFTAGHPLADHLADWLLVTGVLFGASALIYAARLGAALRTARRVSSDA